MTPLRIRDESSPKLLASVGQNMTVPNVSDESCVHGVVWEIWERTYSG